jgi:hypothetical protein
MCPAGVATEAAVGNVSNQSSSSTACRVMSGGRMKWCYVALEACHGQMLVAASRCNFKRGTATATHTAANSPAQQDQHSSCSRYWCGVLQKAFLAEFSASIAVLHRYILQVTGSWLQRRTPWQLLSVWVARSMWIYSSSSSSSCSYSHSSRFSSRTASTCQDCKLQLLCSVLQPLQSQLHRPTVAHRHQQQAEQVLTACSYACAVAVSTG